MLLDYLKNWLVKVSSQSNRPLMFKTKKRLVKKKGFGTIKQGGSILAIRRSTQIGSVGSNKKANIPE